MSKRIGKLLKDLSEAESQAAAAAHVGDMTELRKAEHAVKELRSYINESIELREQEGAALMAARKEIEDDSKM